MRRTHWLVGTQVLVITLLLGQVSGAQQQTRGIAGQEAPSWEIEEWINLPEGKSRLDISDFEGKVLYVLGFQSWCPGCHSHGFPTLKQVMERFRGADDVAFVAVQTTFEGFSTNGAEAAWKTADKYDLEIPVAHDGSKGKRSKLMQAYRTGGTPWTIIIDKKGVVRFNDFHVAADKATALIERLRAEGS
jgi:thiol-disulfide isomerase/thioredoxin